MKKTMLIIAAVSFLFTSCKDDITPAAQFETGPNKVMFAINDNNELIMFNASAPGTAISKMPVMGISSGEKLVSIDFRPATGELYGLSNASKLYVINQSNGRSRVVNAAPFTPITVGIASIDFNPTVDRIRVVTSTGQNLRVNPENGVVAATDANISGTNTTQISGIAYTNSKAGAAATVLYDIDLVAGKLYRQDPPNMGTLVEIGNLGINYTGNAAFDISNDNVAVFAASGMLFSIDLGTGKAGKIGNTSDNFIDIAIPTEPVAYAVDASNNLIIFNPANIAGGTVSKAITGLQAAENILGIDFRLTNGQLYALGSSSRLYAVNLSSGAATQVGTGTFATALAGTDFGFDFNPTVDRIRVVSNTGQNLRLNPNDGTIAATDGVLNPAAPMVSAAAYTNNFAGATTTTLYVMDHGTDKLYIQNPPNNGTLVEVGSLGVNIGSTNGFDIGSRSGTAYLVNGTNMYTVNLSNGVLSAPITFPVGVKAFSIGTGF